MNTETLARTKVGGAFVRVLAAAMESRLRYRFFGPDTVLEGVDGLPGRAVLEVGCGTGFFTIPAARAIGPEGSLVAIDILEASAALVAGKAKAAGLDHVRVLKADGLHTGLDAGGFDTVLLFGVIPAPMVPLAPLLSELHRVLKPGGNLAVWPPVPVWVPRAVVRSGLFALASRRNHVCNFTRRPAV